MLWNVRIPLKKKLALMSLFSLTVIVMGTTIARVSVIPTSHSQADVSWLYFWHNLELAVSTWSPTFTSSSTLSQTTTNSRWQAFSYLRWPRFASYMLRNRKARPSIGAPTACLRQLHPRRLYSGMEIRCRVLYPSRNLATRLGRVARMSRR